MSGYRMWQFFLALGLTALTVGNIVTTGQIGLPAWVHWVAAIPLSGGAAALFLESGDRR